MKVGIGAFFFSVLLLWSPHGLAAEAGGSPPEEAGADREIAKVRSFALWDLCNKGSPETVPAAIKGLEDKDPLVQLTAVEILAREFHQDSVEKIAALLDHPNKEVSMRVLRALTTLSVTEYADKVIPYLRDADVYSRAAAAAYVIRFGNREDIDHTLPLLKDAHAEVRREIPEALALAGAREHIEHLVPLLSDGSPDVLCGAVQALGDLGASHHLRTLLALMSDSDSNESVQMRVAIAIGQLLRDTKDQELKKECISTLEKLTSGKDSWARMGADIGLLYGTGTTPLTMAHESDLFGIRVGGRSDFRQYEILDDARFDALLSRLEPGTRELLTRRITLSSSIKSSDELLRLFAEHGLRIMGSAVLVQSLRKGTRMTLGEILDKALGKTAANYAIEGNEIIIKQDSWQAHDYWMSRLKNR